MSEQTTQPTWTVYAPEGQKEQINAQLHTLNALIAEETGVEGLQVQKAILIILALRQAIELRNPSGLRK